MATISQRYVGEPEFGPEITPGNSSATKPRVLLGWNHTNDTLNGLQEGKMWCWVTEGDSLQVFDQNFNRSKIPGVSRDCGVANFTMVRMFHRYWCKNGQIPRDMVWKDKRECRHRYNQLLRDWRVRNNLPVGDEIESPVRPRTPEQDQPMDYSARSRSRRSVNSSRQRTYLRTTRRMPVRLSLPVTGTVERLGGHDLEEPMYVADSDADEMVAPTSSTRQNRSMRNDNTMAAIRGHTYSTNRTDDRVANANQGDEVHNGVHDILSKYEPPRARSFTRVDIDPFKRSPVPRYYPGMLKSLSRRSTDSDRSTFLLRDTSPLESSGAIAVPVNFRSGASAAIPTVELDTKDDMQSIKDEKDDETDTGLFPASMRPEVILLDD